MNIANKLTVLRVFMIPLFLLILYSPIPNHNLIALAIFILASITDFLDGHLARKYDLITDFGKFADPLADKVLVLTAMLWFIGNGQMPVYVVAVVIFREFAISGIRLIAAQQGKVIAAGITGKIKTASTMVALCIMFLPIPTVLNTLCNIVITVTTVVSGIDYFVHNKNLIDWKNI